MTQFFRTAVVVVVAAVLAGCAAANSPPPTAVAPTLDAPAAVTRLAGAGLVSDPVMSTAETDPNQLLGRPGSYSARATFVVPGVTGLRVSTDPQACDRGGCVEQWSDSGAAQTRKDYIAQIAKGLPAAVEYGFVRPDGLLLRIGGAATPVQAEAVGKAFLAL